MRKFEIVSMLIAICLLSTFLPSVSAGIVQGISFEHKLANSKVLIRTSYWSDYGNGTWKITDNKNLWIKLEVIEQPSNWTILVEHMHADCTIEATSQTVDGILQDVMDDKMHTGTQEGFYVSPKYPYIECFSVEGYSKWLIDAWMFIFSGYGAGGATEERLTEKNLRDEGAVGSEFTIIYDVLIKAENESYFHKEIIRDNFIVYYNGQFQANIGGQAEYYEEERWILPHGLEGAVIILVGLVFFACSLAIDENKHPNVRKTFMIMGLLLIFIGGVVAFWGIHMEKVKVGG